MNWESRYGKSVLRRKMLQQGDNLNNFQILLLPLKDIFISSPIFLTLCFVEKFLGFIRFLQGSLKVLVN